MIGHSLTAACTAIPVMRREYFTLAPCEDIGSYGVYIPSSSRLFAGTMRVHMSALIRPSGTDPRTSVNPGAQKYFDLQKFGFVA